MRWITKHKGAAAAIAVILLTLALAVSSFFTKGRTSPVSGAINTVFRPLHLLTSSVSDAVTGMSDAMSKYEALLTENERLRVYIAQMEEERRLSDELIAENQELRRLLDLGLRERGFTFEIASVVQRNPSEWERTLRINKGSEAGIEVGQCVISSEEYLIGIVSQTGIGWSVIQTIIDTGFAAGAKLDRNEDLTAVAEGDWSLMREKRLKFSLLPLGSDILHGDVVLTSGLGGVYPPDIPIGTVAGVQTDLSGQTEYADLIPLARLDELMRVFVVLEYTSKE